MVAKLQAKLEKTHAESKTEIADLKKRLEVDQKKVQDEELLLKKLLSGEDKIERLLMSN